MNKEARRNYQVAEHQHKPLEIIGCPFLEKSYQTLSLRKTTE
jgi:hypothetical protein